MICLQCKIEKSIDFINKNGICKECAKINNRIYYIKNRSNLICKTMKHYNENKDKIALKRKQHRVENNEALNKGRRERNVLNKEKILLAMAKNRSKNKNIEFNLTIEDIKIPEICPVLGIPIFRDRGRGDDNSPSIDRIDNTKGYIKGNICVISRRANTIKSCGSLEDHQKVIDYIKSRTII